jgi:hypothetical protein
MKIELDFVANKTCQEIMLAVFCDENKIAEFAAEAGIKTVKFDISDDPADHVLRLILSGKNRRHTQIDDQGQITNDVHFSLNRIEFEDLDLREIFCQGLECYTHSFNETKPSFVDEFYGYIGCNGTIEFKFSTPVFLWLNQHFD